MVPNAGDLASLGPNTKEGEQSVSRCIVDACDEHVSRAGFRFCYEHWQAERDGEISACEDCGTWKNDTKPRCFACYKAHTGGGRPLRAQERLTLSATQFAETLGLSARRLNSVFAELGWITKEPRGWVATRQGLKLGAVQKEHPQSGQAYVVWPVALAEHPILRGTVDAVLGTELSPAPDNAPAPVNAGVFPQGEPSAAQGVLGFRDKFPTTHRTLDGHLVRSKAEMLVDNYLYMAQIVHAYERRVPIVEDLYCDFYLPEGKVYIEYWGLDANPRYSERKAEKQELYRRNGLNLLELDEEDIKNLDDVLPRKLLRFNIQSR